MIKFVLVLGLFLSSSLSLSNNLGVLPLQEKLLFYGECLYRSTELSPELRHKVCTCMVYQLTKFAKDFKIDPTTKPTKQQLDASERYMQKCTKIVPKKHHRNL